MAVRTKALGLGVRPRSALYMRAALLSLSCAVLSLIASSCVTKPTEPGSVPPPQGIILGSIAADPQGHNWLACTPSDWYEGLFSQSDLLSEWVLNSARQSSFNAALYKYLGITIEGDRSTHLTNVSRISLSEPEFYNRVLPALRFRSGAVRDGYYVSAAWHANAASGQADCY